MSIWSIPVTVYATAYVRADNEDEARELGSKLRDYQFEVTGCSMISDKQFDDPDLPDVSLSPAMQVGDLDYTYMEEVE